MYTNHHLIVGAGAIGRSTALHLAGLGQRVIIATRSGSGPEHDLIQRVRLDATDADAVTRLAAEAKSIVNAVNPPYTRWARDWPPLASAMLTAAENSGAGYVIVGNLYAYGPVSAPITEDQLLRPQGTKGAVRAKIWREALVAQEAGRVRTTEVRASDYFGPAAGAASYLGQYVLRPALAGKPVRLVMGEPDAPHSWTYVPDIAALVAAIVTSDLGWGRPWHVPSAPPISVAEVAREATALEGLAAPRVGALPGRRLLRQVVPLLRELNETEHQFSRPFVLDATETSRTFGLAATPWDVALKATVAAGFS